MEKSFPAGMSSLPLDIISDILSRLPVKPLLRNRCVSKEWCGVIDDPFFAKLHLRRSFAAESNVYLVGINSGNLTSIDLGDDDLKIYKIDPSFAKNRFVRLLGCCHGLLLLEVYDFGHSIDLVLYNLCTRKHSILPRAFDREDAVCKFFGYVGYDTVRDDYKVFSTLAFSEDNSIELIEFETRVYSLKLDSWNVIDDFGSQVPYKWGAYLNGTFHDFIYEGGGPTPVNIAAYVIGTGEFKLLPMPPEFQKEGLSMSSLKVIGECLCVVGAYENEDDIYARMDIWIMVEYGANESWIKLMSFTDPWEFSLPMPVAYIKNCNEVVINIDGEMLAWYDLRRKNYHHGFFHKLPERFYPMGCVGSLVSLRNGREEPMR